MRKDEQFVMVVQSEDHEGYNGSNTISHHVRGSIARLWRNESLARSLAFHVSTALNSKLVEVV